MDWQLLAVVILGILAIVASGLAMKFKKEGMELYQAIRDAFRDGDLDDTEIARIIKEGDDFKQVIFDIAKLFAKAK